MDRMKNLRILVTGGAGFIGSTLVKRLAKEGAYVIVIDNLWRGTIENLRRPDGAYAIDLSTQFIQADLVDYTKCLQYVRDVDVVYHLADVVAGIDYVFGHELFVFRQNLVMNTNVLSACIVNRVPDYIYVGTACSFPRHLQMQEGVAALRESQAYPAEPESSYGWSKLMGEYESELARKAGAINVGLLRFHNVYGPGSSFEKRRSQVIPSLILKALNCSKEPFVVWGSGTQYRDFVYIDDVIDALLLVYIRGMNHGVIQIGSETPTTITEVAEQIISIDGKSIALAYDLSKPEGDHGRIAVCDRAKAILGWKARTSFDEGLQKTYAWIAEEYQKQQP